MNYYLTTGTSTSVTLNSSTGTYYFAGSTGNSMAFAFDPNDYAGSLVTAFFAKLRRVLETWAYEQGHLDDRHKQAIQAALLAGRKP